MLFSVASVATNYKLFVIIPVQDESLFMQQFCVLTCIRTEGSATLLFMDLNNFFLRMSVVLKFLWVSSLCPAGNKCLHALYK